MIIQYPNALLTNCTDKVDSQEFGTDKLKTEVSKMFISCEQNCGVGLAYNQEFGNKSIFVVNFKDKDGLFARVFINPEMVGHSNETIVTPELCLSLPGVKVNKERWKFITLRWMDVEGKEYQETFEGFKAVVISHELNHLEGKTIISSLPILKQRILVEEMRKNLKKKSRIKKHAKT